MFTNKCTTFPSPPCLRVTRSTALKATQSTHTTATAPSLPHHILLKNNHPNLFITIFLLSPRLPNARARPQTHPLYKESHFATNCHGVRVLIQCQQGTCDRNSKVPCTPPPPPSPKPPFSLLQVRLNGSHCIQPYITGPPWVIMQSPPPSPCYQRRTEHLK